MVPHYCIHLLQNGECFNQKKGEKIQMSDDKFGREMHKVNCSECGKETEVPFKPDGDRPVYCRECYQKHKKPSFNRGGRDRY